MTKIVASDVKSGNQTVTAIFINRIQKNAVDDFKNWQKNIHEDTRRANGFVDVSSHQTNHAGVAEFVTLVTFADQVSLNSWVTSEQSRNWLKSLPDLQQDRQSEGLAFGLGPWISTEQKPPPFWKQVILGVVTVYPSVLLLNSVLEPILSHLPLNVGIFVVVVVLSILLTWPIMPLATRFLSRWLHKS